MAVKAERGTKRTCQNTACGARFYDLNRDPITCPVCSSVYALPLVTAGAGSDYAAQRRASRRAPFKEAPVVDAPEVEAEEALVDVEGAEEPVAAGEEETFLEPEEDEGGEVSDIIGSTPEGEEER